MTDLPGGMPPATRDLAGYGRTPPDPRWPSGARLALSFAVNVEEGAELSTASGDERNERVPESPSWSRAIPIPAWRRISPMARGAGSGGFWACSTASG